MTISLRHLRTNATPRRAAAALGLALVLGPAALADEPPSAWILVDRAVLQDRGHWQVDYTLRPAAPGPGALTITPEDVTARVEGDVSNSRVPAHACPRASSATLSGPGGLAAVSDVIAATDEARRCRERVRIWLWPAGEPTPATALGHAPPTGTRRPDRDATVAPPPAVRLAPGQDLRVRLRLDHDHFLYGPYDPLLGRRAFELRLGPTAFRDAIPLDRERCLAGPSLVAAPPPSDRLDDLIFLSGPDSLHLEAHVPSRHSYRFPEQPVRYATPMRLSYWYLIAPGTEGECRLRISQYRDAPASWKVLSEGGRDEALTVVGRWTRAEHRFRTEPEATSLSIDFRIAGAEIGEMWIDDLVLEPVPAETGP